MLSIRKALLLTLLPAVLLLMAVAVFTALHEVRDEIGELFDAQLVQAAFAVPTSQLETPSDVVRDKHDDPTHDMVIAVWDASEPHPAFFSRTHAPLERPKAGGFSRAMVNGERWRMYARQAGSRWIQVAQPLRIRAEASADIVSGLTLPMVLLVPIVVITVLLLVKRGLRPLTHFAAEIDARSHYALESVPIHSLPAELLPMATAMNQLLMRLQVALNAQEIFVADAAHELLTPLTALQVQVQMLERAKSDERRLQVTSDVRSSLERCSNLARQLLSLARHSSGHPAELSTRLLLGSAVRAAMSEVLPKAHERSIDLGIATEADCSVFADEKAIQTLLRNLLDNAIKYSPAFGRVDVSIALRNERPVITVSDTGPGIAPAEQARVFDRFYRGSGVDAEGSGLGLAIAREIAERHAVILEIRSPGRLGGLDMNVIFPAHPAANSASAIG